MEKGRSRADCFFQVRFPTLQHSWMSQLGSVLAINILLPKVFNKTQEVPKKTALCDFSSMYPTIMASPKVTIPQVDV